MNKKGFTLAEVLVTIGIIGVIAAVSLPALRADINKNEWVQSLKVNYHDLQQGFERMMADQDVSDMNDTDIWENFVDNEGVYNKNDGVEREFARYFKFNEMTTNFPENYRPLLYKGTSAFNQGNFLNNEQVLIFKMANSSFVIMNIRRFVNYGIASVVIDVNGAKGPNKVGRDLFLFYLQDDGSLKACGIDNDEWKSGTDGCIDSNLKNNNIDGWYCSSRIITDGWKMNY